MGIPEPVRVSQQYIDSRCVYLIHNGQQMMLWVGKAVPSTVIKQLFNVDVIEAIDTTIVGITNLFF